MTTEHERLDRALEIMEQYATYGPTTLADCGHRISWLMPWMDKESRTVWCGVCLAETHLPEKADE